LHAVLLNLCREAGKDSSAATISRCQREHSPD
jgi:hypothetical protein